MKRILLVALLVVAPACGDDNGQRADSSVDVTTRRDGASDGGADGASDGPGIDAPGDAADGGNGDTGSGDTASGDTGTSLTDAGCQGAVGGTSAVWSKTIDSPTNDQAEGVATDSAGNVFVAASTTGALGPTDLGFQDALLRKYDSSGTVKWTYQFGSSSTDTAEDVIVDGSGAILVVGLAAAKVGSATYAGKFDSYVQKLSDGATAPTVTWTHQYGTAQDDYVFDAATDFTNNVYVVGWTAGDLEGSGTASNGPSDGYLRKLNSLGAHQWTRQFGAAGRDQALRVSADRLGQVVVVGYLSSVGTPAVSTSYVRAYSSAGGLNWEKTLPAGVSAGAVVTNFVNGDVYVAATTKTKLGCQQYGAVDGVVIKYDASGNMKWTHQFPNLTRASDITIASGPVLYVSGDGRAPGSTSADAFVHKIDASGATPTTVWSHGVLTGAPLEFIGAVTTDLNGDVFTATWVKITNNGQGVVTKLAR